MPRVVVRKSYRCQPGKRRELLAALQRMDAAAAEAGWPRGRYLLVETRAPGEPDVEVEFTFASYTEMEQLERRLRERLGRASRETREAVSGGQEYLLEPSATRFLLLVDDATPAGSSAAGARRQAASPPPRPPEPGRAPAQPASPGRQPPATPMEPEMGPDLQAFDEPDDSPPPPPPPPLSPAEQRARQARQLADARAALANAERAVNLPPEKRTDRPQS